MNKVTMLKHQVSGEIHPRNAYCLAPMDDDPNGPMCGKPGTRIMDLGGDMGTAVLCEAHAEECNDDEEDDGDDEAMP